MYLNKDTAVYPGNPPVTIEHFKSASGGSRNSAFHMGTHVGTHIDAPNHAFADRLDIDDLSLNTFVGPCRVLDLTTVKRSITREDLEKKNIARGERILLKTANSARGFEKFYDDYVYLSGDAAKYLAERGVMLVGIDAWSVKQKGLKDNTPHTHLLEKYIPIIEGLDLKQTVEDTYFLIALPLRLQVPDGAPARVILLQ